MAAVDVGARDPPSAGVADDLDDLVDYDIGNVFHDVDTNMDVTPQQKVGARVDRQETAVGLGIDEEIKVTKKRALVPKLDENRFAFKDDLDKFITLMFLWTPWTCWNTKVAKDNQRPAEV